MLRPIIVVILVLRTSFAFAVFDEVLAITQGGPGDATWVASWYSYKKSFSPPFNIGLGAASAYVLAIIIGLIAIAYVGLIYRRARSDASHDRWTRAALHLANLLVIVVLPAAAHRGGVRGACSPRRACTPTPAGCWPPEWTLDNFRVILSGGAQRGKVFEQATYLPDNIKKFHFALINSTVICRHASPCSR